MKNWWSIFLGLILMFGLGACSRVPEAVAIEPAPPKPIIYDTDMAHEDMIAALFLMGHPNAELKAITVSGTGEAHCQPGVRTAQGLAALAGMPELPVACGRETPLQGNHEFPADWRQGADDAYGVPLPDNPNPPAASEAADLIAKIVSDSPQKVTLVAVGPLTNLGEALREHPEIVQNIAEIYIMGGAVDVPGNVGASRVGIDNQLAEWNIYIDPVAANLVLASGARVVLVPLDATQQVPITRRFYNTLGKARATPVANFVYDVLATQRDFINNGGFEFWDTLTSAVALHPDLTRFESRDIRVVEEEGNQSGWTQTVPDGYPVQVALSGEAERFEALLLTVLNRGSP